MDDPPGVVEFCGRMRPRLVGALSLYCGDRGVAEELAQETLIRVWDRWAQVAAMAAPEAWTNRVAFNLANSLLRRRGAERRALARAKLRTDDRYDNPDTPARMAALAALAALPARQRTAILLRYYVDLSVTQAADVMGCAPGTVKALTHGAIATLRRSRILTDPEEVSGVV